jgi:PE family
VSAAIASLFSGHAQAYQALGAQAAAFHEQFVQALTAGAGSYVSAEAANAASFTANPAQTIQTTTKTRTVAIWFRKGVVG